MMGGDNYFKLLFDKFTPKGWCAAGTSWPPRYKNKVKDMTFGVEYHRDHLRSSGCEVSIVIKRDFHGHPDKDMYSIIMRKGWHRIACNHITAANTQRDGPLPGLHPLVDLFVRKKVEREYTKDVQKPGVVCWRGMKVELAHYLRTTLALHCTYPHPEEGHDAKLNKNRNFCKHEKTHSFLATEDGYDRASIMPPTVPLVVKARGRFPACTYLQSANTWTTIDHMLIEDGFSNCGSHVMHSFALNQVKRACAKGTRHFAGFGDISDSTTADSGVGAMHETFDAQNLFARWKIMINRRNPQKNDPGFLDPFEFNQIGLLYRPKTPEEKTIDKSKTEKRKRDSGGDRDADTAFAEELLGIDGEDNDPRNVPFEFISTQASLISIMVGVVAWAKRRVSGRVQFCADNMYNCVKGVSKMYWFNTGIMDAKGIHFPTVISLTLGHARPRNMVSDDITRLSLTVQL